MKWSWKDRAELISRCPGPERMKNFRLTAVAVLEPWLIRFPSFPWMEARAWVERVNRPRFLGNSARRLPTVPELFALAAATPVSSPAAPRHEKNWPPMEDGSRNSKSTAPLLVKGRSRRKEIRRREYF